MNKEVRKAMIILTLIVVGFLVIYIIGQYKKRLDILETRFDILETRFDTLKNNFNDFEKRSDKLRSKVETLEMSINELYNSEHSHESENQDNPFGDYVPPHETSSTRNPYGDYVPPSSNSDDNYLSVTESIKWLERRGYEIHRTGINTYSQKEELSTSLRTQEESCHYHQMMSSS